MIPRILENEIVKRMDSGKAVVLLGPRQTGKTTLLEKIASGTGEFLLMDCDQIIVGELSDDRAKKIP
jgi:predicted AAA+ superfamily ATPase